MNSNYDDYVTLRAIPMHSRFPHGIEVIVAGYTMSISEDAHAGHVMRAVDAGREFYKSTRKAYCSPKNSVLVRDDDLDYEDGEDLPPPSDDETVPADLSTLEDGDTVHVYGLPEDERPGYPELVGGGDDA